jgi:hypothetical protein
LFFFFCLGTHGHASSNDRQTTWVDDDLISWVPDDDTKMSWWVCSDPYAMSWCCTMLFANISSTCFAYIVLSLSLFMFLFSLLQRIRTLPAQRLTVINLAIFSFLLCFVSFNSAFLSLHWSLHLQERRGKRRRASWSSGHHSSLSVTKIIQKEVIRHSSFIKDRRTDRHHVCNYI